MQSCLLPLPVELFSDKSNTHEFVNLVKELALPGELTQNRSYDFEFMQVEKPYESYVGANVRLRLVLFSTHDANEKCRISVIAVDIADNLLPFDSSSIRMNCLHVNNCTELTLSD